jgi:RimJ/RimL family protein N-acetyltransferase
MQIVTWSPDILPRIAPLFERDQPAPARLWAMLAGTCPGRLALDDPTAPRFALLQELAEGTAYVGGAPDPEAIAAGITLLRAHQDVVICRWPRDPLLDALPPDPDYRGAAIDFHDRDPQRGAALALPDGYQLRRIDADIAGRLEGFGYYDDMFGGRATALAQTVGFCALRGDEVAAESVAGPIAGGIAEIGVGTAEAHRRRGLAAAVSEQTIREVEARGLRAIWNASEHNAASLALARRLGFRTERPFAVLAWGRT